MGKKIFWFVISCIGAVVIGWLVVLCGHQKSGIALILTGAVPLIGLEFKYMF